MKLNKNILAIVAFTLFSFSTSIAIKVYNNSAAEPSSFTRWNSYQNQQISRAIASSHSKGKEISCEFDELNLVDLKQEIKKLEESFETGHQLEGKLFGLNLKKIPLIQAQFLSDNKLLIGDQAKSLDSANCSDALCLLSKIYSGSEIDAHLSYYWYLKTGNMLSASNRIPGQKSFKNGVYNKKEYSLKDYLFSTEELKNFYILSKSLPVHFLHTPLLKSIHKVPGDQIENSDTCTQTTKAGAILITSHCLKTSSHEFLLKITAQIAHYVDREKGLSQNISKISDSKSWKESSLWTERSHFDISNKLYHHAWKSYLPQKNFISQTAMKSPSSQLTEIVAAYRYDNKRYVQQTPIDIQNTISAQFFDHQKFDDSGLYQQFIQQATAQWSKQELSIWSDCLNNHLPNNSGFTARDLASKIDSPLFTCVERKIPSFINNLVTSIKSKRYEGCKFFNDDIGYSHLSQKFYSDVEVLLQEKIGEKKVELQKHGDEVLEAQRLKDSFVINTDPVKVFIGCFSEDDQRSCFNKKISYEASKILIKKKKDFSKTYYSTLSKDFNSLFDFDQSRRNAYAFSKSYLTPFYSRVSSATNSVWKSCKDKSFSENDELKFPMTFTGGKHYVNAKLLNCVNSTIDEKLFDLVDFKATKRFNNKEIQFSLSSNEKIFVKNFIKKRLIQNFSQLLEQEVVRERQIHAKYFTQKRKMIIDNFLSDKDFTQDVYSFKQMTERCIDKVSSFYPKSYFTVSKGELHQKHGKKLCQTILSHEKISSKINNQIQKHWSLNRDIAKGLLKQYFTEYSNQCKLGYPINKTLKSSKNKKLRRECIQDSFKTSLTRALDEWKDRDSDKNFKDKEKALGRELASLEEKSIAEKLR